MSTTPDPVGDTPKGKLTNKERKAIDIRSLTLSAEESLGTVARVRFAGNFTALVGRGHLRRARVELVLRPGSPDLEPIRLVTKGSGIIGRTVPKTSWRKAGVIRDGRILSFLVFGQGYSSLATAEVRVLGAGGQVVARRGGKPVADSSGPVSVPKGEHSCNERRAQRAALEISLAFLEEAWKGVERARDEVDKAIRTGILEHKKFIEGVWYKIQTFAGNTTLDNDFVNSQAKLRKLRDQLDAAFDNLRDAWLNLRSHIDALGEPFDCPSCDPPRRAGHDSFGAAEPCLAISPISAEFVEADRATYYWVPSVTQAPDTTISYEWTLSLQAVDPSFGVDNGCINTRGGGFSGSASWFMWAHGNIGDPVYDDGCDHSLQGQYGHQGLITVVVRDSRGQECTATYKGTNTSDANSVANGVASNPTCTVPTS